jgi:hypothetical protein
VFPAYKGESNSIRCWEERGPSFGNGELEAENEPFNGNRACRSWSWSHGGAYKIRVDSQGRSMLTNQPSQDRGGGDKLCWFTISELEIWKVKMVGGEKKQK